VSSPVRPVALVVEDDEAVASLLAETLSQADFDVHRSANGRDAIAAVSEVDPDLVTLDLNLPDLDGVEVCRRIRQATDAYIVMLSARAEEVDRLIGLEIGADDYLTKPFSPREVRARVLAMLRRPRREKAPEPAPASSAAPAPDAPGMLPTSAPNPLQGLDGTVSIGDLVVDVDSRTVTISGSELALTRTEFELLATLMSNPRKVWPRDVLLKTVWGTDWVSDGHLVEVHMGNLRRKLGDDPRQGRYVRTVRGIGYRIGSG
jgi:two-component system, OmpR family, response regulator